MRCYSPVRTVGQPQRRCGDETTRDAIYATLVVSHRVCILPPAILILVGLYYKLHGTYRPVTMKKSFIKRRKRITPSSSSTDHTLPKAGTSGPSTSPDIRLAALPERQYSTQSHIDSHLQSGHHHMEHHQHPPTGARGPPPVDFTTYANGSAPLNRKGAESVSIDPPQRLLNSTHQSPSGTPLHGEHDTSHKRSFSDLSPHVARASPICLTPDIGQAYGTAAPSVSSIDEDDRDLKRRRKRELEAKIRAMQLEMQRLDDSGDERS